MADINVVRKGPNVWPWLIAIALIVVAVIWMNRDDDVDRVDVVSTSPYAAPSSPAPASSEPLPPAVVAFVTFAEVRPPTEVGPAHNYTSTGIDRLASALDAVMAPDAGRDDALTRRLEAFREKAARLQSDPSSRQHSNLVREVFTSAVDVIAAAQQGDGSQAAAVRGQLDQLRQSAEAVDAGTPLLDQTARVTAFFDRAADTLQALARARRG